MDIFIDKFAQRRNAQEMIRANYMAEAEENERLTSKLHRYDEALQDMRKLSLQNIENAEKTKLSWTKVCVKYKNCKPLKKMTGR